MNLAHHRPACLRSFVATLPKTWHIQHGSHPAALPGAGATSRSMALAACCRQLGVRHQFTRFGWPRPPAFDGPAIKLS